MRGAGSYAPLPPIKKKAVDVVPITPPLPVAKKEEGTEVKGDVVKELDSIITAAQEVVRRIDAVKAKLMKK